MLEWTRSCRNCQAPMLTGMNFCPRCGVAIVGRTGDERRWLPEAIADLTLRVARGEGDHTLTALRDSYVAHLRDLTTPPVTAPPRTDQRAPAPTVAIPGTPPFAAPPATSGAPLPAWLDPVARPLAQPLPAGPAFVWRAFLAEQSIAILAYLGAFLLIIATLSFELGGWRGLGATPKLVVVVIVYVAFGALGIAFLRRSAMSIIGRAYLGVFALMTPLVALAIDLFALNGVGFPAAGMLCLASFYAAAIYIALAWRTGFTTYGALGWAALLSGSLAVLPWGHLAPEWALVALALDGIALILPSRLRWPPAVTNPSFWLAALASALCAGGLVLLDDILWRAAAPVVSGLNLNAYALSSVALVPLAALWSHTLRQRSGSPALLQFLDWCFLASWAQVVVGIAVRAGVSNQGIVLALAAVALGEGGVALVLRWRDRQRTTLRRGVWGLALGLALLADLTALLAPQTRPEFVVALAVSALVAVGLALAEDAPSWMFLAGALGGVGFWNGATLAAGVPVWPELTPTYRALALVEYAFTIALWAVGTLLTRRWPRHAWALLGADLVNGVAVIVLLTLVWFDPGAVETALLVGFLALGGVAAYRLKRDLASYLLTASLGGWILIEILRHPVPDPTLAAWRLVGLLGAPVGVALGLRRLARPRIRWVLYGLASVAPPLALIAQPPWPFFAWWLALSAALFYVVAVVERRPWLTGVVVVYGGAALLLSPAQSGVWAWTNPVGGLMPLVILLVALALAVVARRRGGWPYAGAAYGLAVAASLVIANRAAAESSLVGALALAVFCALAYALPLVAGQPREASAAVIYAAGALLVAPARLPGPLGALDPLGGALALGFLAAGIVSGLVARRGRDWTWSASGYAVAVLATVAIYARVKTGDPGTAEATFLVIAVLAYGVAALERQPLIGGAAVGYALLAASAQPDGRSLLPVTLALAAFGVTIGRVGGVRWSWPAYAAATLFAALTLNAGQRDTGFLALALCVVSLTLYLVALLEARPEVVVGSIPLGVLAVVATAGGFLGWPEYQVALTCLALSGFVFLGQSLWRVLPWLPAAPLPASAPTAGIWRTIIGADRRQAGMAAHRWGAVALGVGVALTLAVAPDAYRVLSPLTLSATAAWLAVAAFLAITARQTGHHVLWYLAGGGVAAGVAFAARWVGWANLQAFNVPIGSYLILVGALLPVDARLGRPARAGQIVSSVGALALLLPTLAQSFQGDADWFYAVFLAFEALALAGVALGTRARTLLLTSVGFVGVAAVRGGVVAVNSGVPVALVIGGFALALLGGATWLSARARRSVPMP